MLILPVVRSLLIADSGVTAKRSGGVHINAAPEQDATPNIVIALVSGVEGFTHQGADGLVSDRVRVWSRGATAQEAGELGAAASDALNEWTGTSMGMTVQVAMKVMTTGDYQEGPRLHRRIDDYMLWWTS